MSTRTVRRQLPALSEYRWLRFGVFTALYLVQGFPIGLVQIAFPAWLTARGIDKTDLATFVAITTLPWAFKLVAGPFMDRLAFPAMGLRRPWVMGTQTMLVLAGCTLFFIHDPVSDLGWLTVACALMNSCAAVQDVAVDGMAITVFKDDERARANAFMIAGQVAGFSLTGWVSVLLLNAYGIPAAGLLTAGLVSAVGLLAFLFRERPGERVFPWSAGAPHPEAPKPVRETRALFLDIVRRFFLPMSLALVGVELTYRMLEGVAEVWWPQLAIKLLHYTDEQFTFWYTVAGGVSAVVGLAVGAWLDRIGSKRGIAIGLISNAVLYLIVWLTADALTQPAYAIAAMILGAIGSQWMFISTVATFMKLCSARIAATQFAVYMGLSNLSRSGGARLFPALDDWVGSANVHVFMTAGYLVALAILALFSLERHREHLARRGES